MYKITERMEIKSRIWIEKDGQPFLGYGRIKLLEAVHETASISAAAKSLGMSYKKAWRLLKDINTKAVQPVLQKTIGGKNGGGTKVTDYGLMLITEFERLNQNCIQYLEVEFKATHL